MFLVVPILFDTSLTTLSVGFFLLSDIISVNPVTSNEVNIGTGWSSSYTITFSKYS